MVNDFQQYQEIIESISRTRDINKILITGSLGHKIKSFSGTLQIYTGIECKIASNKFDSTLLGLKNFCIEQNLDS